MKNTFSRRKFMLTSAATLSGAVAFGHSALPTMTLSQSDKDNPIRVGLIGSGSRGSGIAHVLKELPGISLMACCDVIPAHLEKGMSLADKGAKAYTDYRQLLDDKSLDAVIIAVPLYLHAAVGGDAIEAGKHIYMEKTMTYDIPQALEMVKKVHASDKVFQIGHQYRYYALYHKVQEILEKGWCGEVTHFECQYHSNHDWRRPVPEPKLER